MYENEIIDPGTISSTTTTVCSGQEPADIVGSTPSATISGTSFTFEWYQRANGVTTTWTEIVGETSSTLSFSSRPLYVDTDFIRVTTASIDSTSCTESTTAFYTIFVTSGPAFNFRAPDLTPVTTPYIYNMCSGTNQVFRARGGRSYEFRIGGIVEYTVEASSTTTDVTFDPLVNISPPRTLATSNVIDVIVYDLPLSGGAIDPNACSSSSSSITVVVSPLPSPNLTATNITNDVFCPGQDVDFSITLAVTDSTATFEYNVSTNPGWVSLGSTPTFTVAMPDRVGLSDHATITIRITTGGCSTTVTETLYIEENEIISAGTISSTDLTTCSGTDPEDITEIASPTFTSSGSISYRWYKRSNLVTSTWTVIPGATTRNLSFSGDPITQQTQFRREVINEFRGQSCSDFSSPITFTVPTLNVQFRTPDSSLVTTPTTYSMCSGPAQFRARGGLSYQFRVNGDVVYVTSATLVTDPVTFDPLTDFVSTTYALANLDVVDVVVYDLGLTASGTIDPSACSFLSQPVTIDLAATPSVTIDTVGSLDSYCPSEVVTFTITPLLGVNSDTTFEWNVTGIVSYTSIGTNTIFAVTMPDITGPAGVATITVRSTNPSCTLSPIITEYALPENDVEAGQISITNTIVCYNSEPNTITEIISPTTSYGSSITYQWYQRTTGVTTTWTIVAGSRGLSVI